MYPWRVSELLLIYFFMDTLWIRIQRVSDMNTYPIRDTSLSWSIGVTEPSVSWPFGRGNLLLCICPSPELYIRAARAPIWDIFWSSPILLILHHSRAPGASLQAVHLLALALQPLPPFLHPNCKNFRAFKRGRRTRWSLRLGIGL
jgi:hypothetical protein